MIGEQPRWADSLACPHGKEVAECMRCSLGLEDVPKHHRLLDGWLPFRLSLTVAWYDLWVGAYFDRKQRRLYVLPLPMVGICIQFPQAAE